MISFTYGYFVNDIVYPYFHICYGKLEQFVASISIELVQCRVDLYCLFKRLFSFGIGTIDFLPGRCVGKETNLPVIRKKQRCA